MMPMPQYMGVGLGGPSPPSAYVTDAFLEGLSRQISSAQPRRYSRGSSGHGPHSQHVAGAMRVAKPSSSASSSPRSAMMQARRRTLMNDGLMARRNQQFLEQSYQPTQAVEPVSDDLRKRSARPMSWHPSSSQLALPPQPHYGYAQQQLHPHVSPISQYPFPPSSELDFYSHYQRQFPPTPAAYSEYDSPTAAFSPLALPLPTFEAPRYIAADSWATGPMLPSSNLASPTECPGLMDSTAQYQGQASTANTTPSDSAAQWNSLATPGYNKVVAPPTPDTYPVVPPPEPVISPEESIPFQPLEDDENDGEILIGMGLYDPPEKPLFDTSFDGYRSGYLGSNYSFPEPTGKGLKLEDAWEPPAKDEDDDDDDDDDDSSSESDDAEADEHKEAAAVSA